MTVAGIYVRISRDPTGAELGVRRQEVDCRVVVEARGWDLGELFVDDDRSAYSGKPRPGYERLLVALDEGRIDAVVAWHPDRLHRRPVELEAFIDLIERTGAKVVTCQSGEYDLSSASGRMAARIVGAVARHESEHKSDRLRRKHEELAQAGKVAGGGSRPFGFLADRVTVDPVEAELVREAVARFLAGESIRSLCADWEKRGVPTSTGARWTKTVMRRVVGSPRNAGLREHRGEVVAQAVWPAIIDPADHVRVRSLLDDPARSTRRPAKRYLLSGGLAVCGLCGAALVPRPRADKTRCYVCSTGPGFTGCGKIRVLAERLEDVVVGVVLERLDHLRFADVAVVDEGDDGGGRERDVHDLQERLNEFSRDRAEGRISRGEWLAARDPIEARLRAAREADAATVRATGPVDAWAGRGGALAAVWGDLSLDQRRAITAAVVDVVTVGPAVRGRNRFDPARVDVELRV